MNDSDVIEELDTSILSRDHGGIIAVVSQLQSATSH